MVSPLFISANRRLLLLLSSALVSWPSAYSVSSAAETRDLRQPPRNSTVSAVSAGEPGIIDSVFHSRWAEGAGEYVLDAQGRIRQTQAPTRDDVDVKPAGQTASASRSIEHSQIDFASANNGLPGDAECGPSPLNSEEIARLVAEAASRYGVDRDFALAVAMSESRLDDSRNSPKGARGPMQLMPSTAAHLGVSDICDPAENIDGGVRLLRDLFATYRNPLIVAAAYNAGEARILQYDGVPPFPETVRFVADVINRQLKLPALGRQAGSGIAANPADTGKAPPLIGANSTGKPRQWVGGVLQF
ncbi:MULTISPECIES: lytic transglycosylase domain-containing protein [unclassified Mesorhizobium]|uniref:lytic transglycosylase domain-containing protein n=1 Tax=unclassified Mesorhizobium TaxID=325217 RepID=UPI001129F3E0|nr:MULTISPECIES: lytic transglycosylase domain-containing protein [unclassified Mesorhizobium]MBZ9974050.1 lytic transglycosylase domain-containing protein [Mesorhizobium sp. BR-1-1-10]TPK10427.1 lytic transglycosylase domain-containing protein [Mesorhizobium sp. B2-5-7]